MYISHGNQQLWCALSRNYAISQQNIVDNCEAEREVLKSFKLFLQTCFVSIQTELMHFSIKAFNSNLRFCCNSIKQYRTKPKIRASPQVPQHNHRSQSTMTEAKNDHKSHNKPQKVEFDHKDKTQGATTWPQKPKTQPQKLQQHQDRTSDSITGKVATWKEKLHQDHISHNH